MSRNRGKPPSPEELQAYADGFNRSATLRAFGATLDFPEGKKVRAVLPVKPEQRGGMGMSHVNGAVIAGLFDLIIGCTGGLVDPTRRTATMQLSMSFERGLAGDRVTGEAWIDRVGGSTLFASAVMLNEAGEVCARCQGVVRISTLAWDAGSSPAVN